MTETSANNYPKDVLGREIAIGDYIAHAGSFGRDPMLRIHRVVAIEPGPYPTLRVELVHSPSDWPKSKPGKKSVIHGRNTMGRSIIVTEDYVNSHLVALGGHQ